ncbi:MAG: alanine/glycine:cation symporter family protein [Bacteroidales bacterium]|nr:alanine/glycine:cation symporter family protein [Bacteroidales bacterium]
MTELINTINNALWGYFLIGALLLCALWFTVKTHGVQFTMFKEMVRLLGESPTKKAGKKQVSPFQAFAVSLASRVGTGNLAGVASAIIVGGPGAVFWMWITALFGASISFVECTLAQLFKIRGKDSFIGGPAYYMQRGLHCRPLGVLFALLMVFSFGVANNSLQTNTICGAMEEAFGWNPIVVGVILVIVTLAIIFGGIHRIAGFSSVVVPLMAVGYVLVALVVIGMNIRAVPDVLALIVRSAFGFRQAAGGLAGAAVMQGIKRGLFSNEAGEGSSPNAAATADTSHPVKQGLMQALGVFVDTLVICSCTAFIILCSGVEMDGADEGIRLTQAALSSQIGPVGTWFVAVAILFFAYSSIIGNYYYGEANIRFLFHSKPVASLSAAARMQRYEGVTIMVFRLLTGVMIMMGAIWSLTTVWVLVDLAMALVTTCNLVAVVLLGRYAIHLLADYRSQKRGGIKDPVFHKRDLFPEIADELEGWE